MPSYCLSLVSPLHAIAWLLVCLLALPAVAQDEPDFNALTSMIESSLASAGQAAYPGDRSELYRYTADGWEMQLFAAWSGQRWLPMAVHIHHPDRLLRGAGQWQQRYQDLLADYDPAWLDRLELPDLFEVPPPDYNPAVPDEIRARRFTFAGYWYEARWYNSGGVDDDAVWSLISYDLVALEPPQSEPNSQSEEPSG